MAKVIEKRPDAGKMMDYIRKSDFYTAPASTKYHLSVEGGLLQHSLNVYDCLQSHITSDNEGNLYYKVAGNVVQRVEEENLVIMALLHDMCKTNFYAIEMRWAKDQNNKWYQYPTFIVDDKVPYGHGEKSVMMIEAFMKLTPLERYAIRWHMGYTDDGNKLTLGQAIQKYPMILALHTADQEASSFMEEETGNKFTVGEAEPIFEEAETI